MSDIVETHCWCHTCNRDRKVGGFPYAMTQMIVCPDCGNKRCPKATYHALACTGSNEPNQPGSVYGGLGMQVALHTPDSAA
jgi:hypothetical protein